MKRAASWVVVCLLSSPEALSATAELSWVPPSENVDGTELTNLAGYRLFYSDVSGPPYTGAFATVASPIDIPVASLADPVNPAYILTGLPTCLRVYFAMTAYTSEALESAYTNEVSVEVLDPPVGLTLAETGAGELLVSWSALPGDDAGAVGSYRVRYGTVAGGPYEQEVVVEGSATSVVLSGLAVGTPVHVVLEAVCPEGRSLATDPLVITPVTGCGNGLVEPPESCDGDCPTTCDDGLACTLDLLVGQAVTCDARCTHTPITACASGDGCCAAGCDAGSDSDCSPTCGDGRLDPGEACDGDCPTACDDGDPCSRDLLVGSAASCSAACAAVEVAECLDQDGCCAVGCDAATDDDCSSDAEAPRAVVLPEPLVGGCACSPAGGAGLASTGLTLAGCALLLALRRGSDRRLR